MIEMSEAQKAQLRKECVNLAADVIKETKQNGLIDLAERMYWFVVEGTTSRPRRASAE